VVDHYRSFERLFTIDIDFVCTKVAEGLYIYQGESHRIDPIVSSFWFLPFRGGSIDSVFTRGGLQESREVARVLQEVYRVLK
jgi:ubiquinone/menaquinone biosynthesis C-methylase UbiE